MKTIYLLIFCIVLSSCLTEPKKESSTQTVNKPIEEDIMTAVPVDSAKFENNYEKAEEKKNIFQPIFTLKELVELYIDSPDNFGDSVYKKGFIYDEFEDYDSFNVFSYSKNNYTVTYSIEKHSLKLIGVSYNTDDYNEYTYLISECEKEGYKKEVKVFNLKNVSYIEFSGSTFNVLFYESPDKTKLKYNIHIKNK